MNVYFEYGGNFPTANFEELASSGRGSKCEPTIGGIWEENGSIRLSMSASIYNVNIMYCKFTFELSPIHLCDTHNFAMYYYKVIKN
jgi:hypothetical protein